MNLSGEAVRSLMKFYGVDIEDLIVIHDDLVKTFNQLKI